MVTGPHTYFNSLTTSLMLLPMKWVELHTYLNMSAYKPNTSTTRVGSNPETYFNRLTTSLILAPLKPVRSLIPTYLNTFSYKPNPTSLHLITSLILAAFKCISVEPFQAGVILYLSFLTAMSQLYHDYKWVINI